MQTHVFGRSEAEFSCILSQGKEYSIALMRRAEQITHKTSGKLSVLKLKCTSIVRKSLGRNS